MVFQFNPAKIYCNENAKAEALRIKHRALNKKCTVWDHNESNHIKISTLNVRSLQKHSQDLKDDFLLQQSDIICVNESWLVSDPDFHFEGFHSHYLNMKSKGVALYSKMSPGNVKKIHNSSLSMIVATFKMFDILSVYRFSESTHLQDFTNDVKNYIDCTKAVIVLGDFNIDLLKQPENLFSKSMEGLGFKQLVLQATHISGSLIDHVYVFLPNGEQCEVFKIHPLYYSDHDAICFILKFQSAL